MTKDELAEKVKNEISLSCGVNRDRINDDSRLQEDLGLDSLDELELLMIMEEQFNLEFPDEDWEKLKTVQNVVDYLAPKVGA